VFEEAVVNSGTQWNQLEDNENNHKRDQKDVTPSVIAYYIIIFTSTHSITSAKPFIFYQQKRKKRACLASAKQARIFYIRFY
jgi:hypothetical protein